MSEDYKKLKARKDKLIAQQALDIGELYSEFKKVPRIVLDNEYYRGVADFAEFLIQKQNEKKRKVVR